MRWVILILLIVTVCCIGEETSEVVEEEEAGPIEVILAGTQPERVSLEYYSFCRFCHGNYSTYSPYDTWRGSMMSHAARDPIAFAAIAISNKDFDGEVLVGDYCLRCHTPKGWLEGRSEPVDGSALKEAKEDFDGIICDFCHRMVDPLSEEGRRLATNGTVDAYHNSQYVISDRSAKRGPYEPVPTGHVSKYSEFHTRSDFCGTCHDISNPLYNDEPIERTYTEWKYSAYGLYAPEGNQVTCQDCHMPIVEGYASSIEGARVFRDKVYKHEFAGGTSCAQDMMQYIYEFTDEDILAGLNASKGNAKNMLKGAAELELTEGEGTLEVKITNLAGHKLPTGYSEGRRMWINVKFYDSTGKIIKESGAYDFDTGTLVKDPGLKTYEIKPGIKYTGNPEAFPDRLGIPEGPSFHFAANNYVYRDDRIPPSGFKNDDYEEHKAYIREATYEDGQNWDVTNYAIPDDAASAEVTLYYQTATVEYIEFLYEKNKGNSWDYFNSGEMLYEAWKNTGRCAPTEMASGVVELKP